MVSMMRARQLICYAKSPLERERGEREREGRERARGGGRERERRGEREREKGREREREREGEREREREGEREREREREGGRKDSGLFFVVNDVHVLFSEGQRALEAAGLPPELS